MALAPIMVTLLYSIIGLMKALYASFKVLESKRSNILQRHPKYFLQCKTIVSTIAVYVKQRLKSNPNTDIVSASLIEIPSITIIG